MPAIPPSLPELQPVPASALAADRSKAQPGGAAPAGPPFENVLSNAVNPSRPPVPAAPSVPSEGERPSTRTKAAPPTSDKQDATAKRSDDISDPPPGVAAGNVQQSLVALSATAVNGTPADVPKTTTAESGSNSENVGPAAQSAPLAGGPPAQLVAGLLSIGRVAGNTSSTVDATVPGPKRPQQQSAAAPAEATGLLAGQAANLNLTESLPVTQSRAQASPKPTVPVASEATLDSKPRAKTAEAANGGQPAGTARSAAKDPNSADHGAIRPLTPISATTEVAVALPADSGGSAYSQTFQQPVSTTASDTLIAAQPAGASDSSSASQPAEAPTPYPLSAIAPGASRPQNATQSKLQSGGTEVNPPQVIQQVAHAIQIAQPTGQEGQLQLNPADAGALSVKVSEHGHLAEPQTDSGASGSVDSKPSALASTGAETLDSKPPAQTAAVANTSQPAGTVSISGNETNPAPSGKMTLVPSVSASTQVPAVLPVDAGRLGNSQTLSQPGSKSNADDSKNDWSKTAGTAPLAGPDLAIGGTPIATSLFPSHPQAVSTTAADKGNPAQPAGANDSGSASQPAGAQNPYPLFAVAPGASGAHSATLAGLQGGGAEVNPAQIIQQTAYAIQVTHATGQEMQLQLNPSDLGALSVNVSVHDGVLSARLEAQSPATQQILVDNLSQLKDSLTQQGVAFDRIDVHLAGSQTGSGGSGSADPSFGRQREGGLPWEQAPFFPQSENDLPRQTSAAPRGPVSRLPLTSLDIMV